MTYKETLFFVGKCLTISHEVENRNAIEKILKTETVDWDAVVKVSTAHYVFPALYVNLQRAHFLPYVPEDLVEYMQHITNLNRERNEQIITQAKELNTLLLANGITPIFLKGTGNLLEGLYADLGERMVGDIDFIVEKEDYPKAIALLTDFGYEPVTKYKYYFPSFKHYPRIQKEGCIAAVEIHKELLIEKYAMEFNYEFIKNNTQQFGNITVMSYAHQLCLSIIAKQINDNGRFYNDIALRNAYDVFLLSKKTAVSEAFKGLQKLNEPLLNYIALCFEVFDKPDSLQYQKTATTKQYVADFYQLLENETLRVAFHKKIQRKLFIQMRLQIIYKSIFDAAHRSWLLKRISDGNWYREKYQQLKLIPLLKFRDLSNKSRSLGRN
ncbi:nucleotidyltransferase domain-containing protein [Polaribacter gangjinensis]|uniref:Nucleotidyltransferase n=1 Tax=Polaribacter gangjinensis TaxID=574710 RepID=A0A2S7W8R9_9FLAO|nr:nucleotidyltransferase family protein [Polaribacter gangjinensis]PQJ73806.1 hypothetical protein BTO13_00280 [Polaribacter gangjinensis]